MHDRGHASAKWQQLEQTRATRVLDLVTLVTLVQILLFFRILVTLVLNSSSSLLLLFSRLSSPLLKLATTCYFRILKLANHDQSVHISLTITDLVILREPTHSAHLPLINVKNQSSAVYCAERSVMHERYSKPVEMYTGTLTLATNVVQVP